MLAAADYSDLYPEPTEYENEWIDNHSIRIPWLNYLTAQSIPEETDDIDSPLNLRRYNSHIDDDSSSEEEEDYYIVFEVERPRSVGETTDIMEKVLNFAQINEDEHDVEYDQLAESMVIETPFFEHLIEHETEELIVEEYAKIIQLSNNILFHTINKSDKQQMEITNCILSKHQNLSTLSNDEITTITNFKTIEKINEYRPTCISFVAAKQQSKNIQSQETNLENKSMNQTQVTNNLSQRTFNLIEAQHQKPPRDIKLPPPERTQGRVQELINDYSKLAQRKTNAPLGKSNFKEETSHSIYVNYKSNTNIHSSSKSSSLSNSLSRASAIIRSVKNHTRINATDYPIYDIVNNKFTANEPKLLQVKYYDGRDSLTNLDDQECVRKRRTLSSSISSRLSLSKMSSTQDLSIDSSYRKRMLNRFQTFLKTNSVEEESSNSAPKQQKAIMELFNDKKSKISRH